MNPNKLHIASGPYELKLPTTQKIKNKKQKKIHHIENLKIYLGKNYDMLTRLKSLVLAKVRELKRKKKPSLLN